MGNARIAPNAPCVRDGNLITGTSAGCATAFGLMLIEALKGADEARRIAQQIVIR
jgi:putative intracellular protease/amidase